MSCKSLGSVVQVAMLSPLLNTASRSRRRTSPESQQQDATGHTCAVGAHCAWKERLVGRQPQRQVSTPGRRRIGSSHCWPFFFYIYLFIYLFNLFILFPTAATTTRHAETTTCGGPSRPWRHLKKRLT